jgi:hypothetical protein
MKKNVHQVGYDQAHDETATNAEPSCRQVGPIVRFLHPGQDSLLGGVTDVMAVVKKLRHRDYGDPKLLGNVFHARSHRSRFSCSTSHQSQGQSNAHTPVIYHLNRFNWCILRKAAASKELTNAHCGEPRGAETASMSLSGAARHVGRVDFMERGMPPPDARVMAGSIKVPDRDRRAPGPGKNETGRVECQSTMRVPRRRSRLRRLPPRPMIFPARPLLPQRIRGCVPPAHRSTALRTA